MTLVTLGRSARITLPAALRRVYGLQEGDVLEAEAVEGGILLKPIPRRGREQARRRLVDAAADMRDIAPKPCQTATEEEEDFACIIPVTPELDNIPICG